MDLTVARGANILFGYDPTFFGQPENFKRLAMSFTPNKTLGPCKILAPVGGGGMGEVYPRGAPSSGGKSPPRFFPKSSPNIHKSWLASNAETSLPETPGSKVAGIR